MHKYLAELSTIGGRGTVGKFCSMNPKTVKKLPPFYLLSNAALCRLGDLLFLRNGLKNLCTPFSKNYLYIILEIVLKIARYCILAKQNQPTFYLIKMAGKLFNLNLFSLKDYL